MERRSAVNVSWVLFTLGILQIVCLFYLFFHFILLFVCLQLQYMDCCGVTLKQV